MQKIEQSMANKTHYMDTQWYPVLIHKKKIRKNMQWFLACTLPQSITTKVNQSMILKVSTP